MRLFAEMALLFLTGLMLMFALGGATIIWK